MTEKSEDLVYFSSKSGRLEGAGENRWSLFFYSKSDQLDNYFELKVNFNLYNLTNEQAEALKVIGNWVG